MTIPSFGPQTKLTVGLLGGSFNPAHEGHVYISETALKKLGLDQVWWLVSPQKPVEVDKRDGGVGKKGENSPKSRQTPENSYNNA